MADNQSFNKDLKEMQKYLKDVSTLTERLIRTPEVNGNSLEERYRMTLERKRDHLNETLELLEGTEEVDSEKVSTNLFIIYHADEVGNLHLGGWKRVTLSNGMDGQQTVKEFAEQAQEKKQLLKETTPHIKKWLGQEDYKFIIPTLYRQ